MDLQITSYEKQSIARGGYLISRKPSPVPPGCKLLLGVSTNAMSHVDVTHAPPRDMIHNAANMLSLLKVFSAHYS